MKDLTLEKYNAYLARQAELNNLPFNALATGIKFTVQPSVQQKLYEKVRESSDFLKSISFVFVDEQTGETLGLDSAHTVASTTDTSGDGERKTTSIAKLVKQNLPLPTNQF